MAVFAMTWSGLFCYSMELGRLSLPFRERGLLEQCDIVLKILEHMILLAINNDASVPGLHLVAKGQCVG